MKSEEYTVAVRMSTELIKVIKNIAVNDSCSVSSVIRRACLRYVAERQQDIEKNTIKVIPIDDGE